MAKPKRRRRVPEVLWRLFQNRARTLADAITSLLPPPPSAAECRCKGRRCLGCSGGDATSFLLRPKDPADYRRLLTRCFVVVSDTAPPLSAFYPDRRWPQLEIVRRTIEMILSEQSTSRNVICSGYNKHSRSSTIVELLTCSAWSLLLRRIGDGVMVYLLKHLSIFLPLPFKKHHQVAGFSICNLCFKLSKPTSGSEDRHPPLVLTGYRKKRKRNEVGSTSVNQQHMDSFRDDISSSSVSGIECSCRCSSTLSGKMHSQTSPNGDAMETSRVGNASNDVTLLGELQDSSLQSVAKSRKRVRQFSWQRRRKRRLLSSEETNCQKYCTRNLSNMDSVSERLHYGYDMCSSLHRKMPLQSCCLVLQTLQKVTRKAQINRQSMFYKVESSSSVFPGKHIMNSLKPNISGADVLFKDIFGLSHVNINVQSEPCLYSKGSCDIGSNCLYHSLVKLLKILIRKARHCRHIKLLDKHCATSSDQSANLSKSSMFEGYQPETISLEGQLPLENSCGFDAKICEEIPEATAIQFEPSMSYCPKRQVVSYIWAVCRSIVPPDLLGTSPNWRTLRKNISKFVQLRRFEKFSLKQCMHKLKISNFPFLSNKHTSCYLNSHVPKNSKGQHADVKKVCIEVYDAIHLMKQRVFERWIFWFFSCLVVPLIQANFYVTESECGKQEVFYYRKSVWERLMSRAITSLKDQSYHLLSDVSVRKIIRNRSFGFSRVRLRPKANGVRPLANLKASSRIPLKQFPLRVPSRGLQRKIFLNPDIMKYEYYKPVNGVLRNLHVVLKGIQIEEPEKLGSSVFDYNDIYKKLWPFLSTLKSGLGTVSGVFIVVSDVSKAFDSVCQDKLLNVMKDIILEDNYLLKSFSQVLCTKKNLQVRRNLISVHEDITSGSTKFASLVPGRSLDSIVVDQEQSITLTNEELYFDLNEHVKRNVLHLNRKFYLQNVGIPQGSVLSSLLCSFYYGHLERHLIFPFLERTCIPAGEDLSVGHGHPGTSGALNSNQDEVISSSPKYMLLRFIDDFLFISTSKRQAAMFFSRLRRGFREYNCYMNEEKFGLNFNIDHIQAFQSNRVYIGEDGISFLRWSGLFINCCTSEIQADYTRYLNSHLSSTLTVCWQDKPGCRLKAKLCDYLRPKCHPIFYDSNINSAAVVRLNIYQAFLLCAMKFHCYVRELSNICRLSSEAFMDVIQRPLRYMHKLIKKRMHSVHIDCNFHPLFRLEKREVEWLGLIAYSRVLKRKQSRYQELLSLLKFKLAANAMAGSVSSALTYAVDDSHSSLIWKINY